MTKLYIIGETNCRGHIERVRFTIEKNMVIADLQKAKSLIGNDDELDRLYDDINDEYGYSKSQAIIALMLNDYVDVDMNEYINSNIGKINNNELISIELEETIYGISNTKEKALLAFSNIDESDW